MPAEYGYINYTDAVVTHPMMKFWDNINNCFLDIRNGKQLSHKEIVQREQFFWKLQEIEDEKNNAGPLSSLKRSEWQAFHPNYTIEQFIAANKIIEEEYQEILVLNKIKKQKLLTEIRAKGWTEKEINLNRKKSPEKILARVHRDIKKVCDKLQKSYMLKAVFNSSSLNTRKDSVPYHILSQTLLSNHYSNIYYKALYSTEKSDDKKNTELLKLAPDKALMNWYKSKNFILNEYKSSQKQNLILKNGIDLTAQVIKAIQKDYQIIEKKAAKIKNGNKKKSKRKKSSIDKKGVSNEI